jgi:hypothetical protein
VACTKVGAEEGSNVNKSMTKSGTQGYQEASVRTRMRTEAAGELTVPVAVNSWQGQLC